ncbi:MAG TPA: hypothetical protein VIY27_09635 [Myxococcota bacterium]
MPETRPTEPGAGAGSTRGSLFASSLQFTGRHPGVVALGVAGLLLLIIVLQNLEPTSIDLLFWSVARVPKLVLILASMLLGGLIWEVLRRRLFR